MTTDSSDTSASTKGTGGTGSPVLLGLAILAGLVGGVAYPLSQGADLGPTAVAWLVGAVIGLVIPRLPALVGFLLVGVTFVLSPRASLELTGTQGYAAPVCWFMIAFIGVSLAIIRLRRHRSAAAGS